MYEASAGFEPANDSFANWSLKPLGYDAIKLVNISSKFITCFGSNNSVFFKSLININWVMDIKRLNLYERLRDFMVPSTVLDNIFAEEDDIKILKNAYKSLLEDGFTKDQAADEISKTIFKELDIEPDYSSEVEK